MRNTHKVFTVAALILLAVMFAVSAAFALRACAAPRPLRIGFYGLPERTTAEIRSLAAKSVPGRTLRVETVTLDPSLPPGAQEKALGRLDLLCMPDGKAAAELADRTEAPSPALLAQMPSAMRRAGSADGRQYGLALLVDHFEFAYLRSAFAQKGLGAPLTLEELLTSARKLKRPTRWPLVCAGADDRDLLLLTGAVTESVAGYEGWSRVVAALSDGKSFSDTLASTDLRRALDELIRWREEGTIHAEWLRMKADDVVSFMDNEYAGGVFMSLSEHRAVPQRTIEKYEAVSFPPSAAIRAGDRALTAPAVIVMEMRKKKPNPDAGEAIGYLVGPAGQKELAGATGLAPVNSTAEAADRQAGEARLWVASSSRPIPNPGIAAYADPADSSALAAEIRRYLESGGVGW